jgi:hypothetical protein
MGACFVDSCHAERSEASSSLCRWATDSFKKILRRGQDDKGQMIIDIVKYDISRFSKFLKLRKSFPNPFSNIIKKCKSN